MFFTAAVGQLARAHKHLILHYEVPEIILFCDKNIYIYDTHMPLRTLAAIDHQVPVRYSD